MTASEIVAAVKAQGGFDSTSSSTSDTVILGWVNEVYRQMVGDSKWLRATRELGPTVAAQAQYALPEDVVDLRALRVDGSEPWLRVSTEDLWEIQSGTKVALDTPGVFAPNFTDDGDSVFELYPAPSDVYAISGLCAVLPSALTTSPVDSTPALPSDMHDVLVEGATGIGVRRIYERHDAGDAYDAKVATAVGKLQRRANSRVGSGPIQAKIKGVHF